MGALHEELQKGAGRSVSTGLYGVAAMTLKDVVIKCLLLKLRANL